MCHLHLKLCTPAGRTIFDSVAVFLCVLAFQIDRHAKDHRTRYTDQQVRGMETEPRGGKRRREAVPNGEQLAGKVSTGRKPESLCQLIEGIHEQKIRKVQQKHFFSYSSLHAPIFDLYFLPVNGAVFRFLRRLFLRLGQPLPDGGLFLTAHFPAGKLLKCRCDGIRVPAFEKDQVTGLLCGGVLLQGKIHMVFLRHTGESLDILVTDLDIGKTGVLAGKLFKALPAR